MTLSKKKKVKAWAIVNKRGVFSHTELDKEIADSWEDYKVVPCVITYDLTPQRQ